MRHCDEWYTSAHQAVACELTDMSVGGWAACLDLVETDQVFIVQYGRFNPGYHPADLARAVKARHLGRLASQA